MRPIQGVLNTTWARTQGVLLVFGVVSVVLLAGCSVKGEGSSSTSPQPPQGGATVGAGGNAPSSGLFGSLAALGIGAALVGLFGVRGRMDT